MNKELSCRSLCSAPDMNLPPAIFPVPQQLFNRMHLSYGVAADFTFPHPVIYKHVDVILKTTWVKKLKGYLSSMNPSRQVIVTEATYDFFENLVNWLISAAIVSEVPLQYILVLCFDQQTHNLLAERNINSLYIPYHSLLRNPKLEIGNIWMSRLAVIRLLSHWGYDVQHYDSDAVLLKNPQSLFQRFPSSDIVTSWGDYPDELGKNGPWGTTLCMGAVLIRSSPRAGEYVKKLMYITVKYISNEL